jgi:hypothetical protein
MPQELSGNTRERVALMMLELSCDLGRLPVRARKTARNLSFYQQDAAGTPVKVCYSHFAP